MQRTSAPYALQFVLDLFDALRDAAAVGFQLCLTRTARSNAAAQPRHLFAVAGQPRQQIAQLRQFHLHAALAGPGARSENVQDELSTVDDASTDRLFQVTLLRGRQVVIEYHYVGVHRSGFGRQFLHFALPDQRGRLRPGTRLDHAGPNSGSRGGSQIGKFL
jgi:hypothetical protein